MRKIGQALSGILCAIGLTVITAPSEVSASGWQSVQFRMGAPAKYWDQIAACEAGRKIDQVNWRESGIYAGGLSIQHNGKFGEPNMGVWEQYGGEQFADSPDKANRLEQIIVANRIAVTGFKKITVQKMVTGQVEKSTYHKHPVGFDAWSCVSTKKVEPYSRILYTVSLPVDPTFSCPRFENVFRKYGLPVQVFSYIAYRESRCNPGAVNAKWKDGKMIWTLNSNGTYDSGLLQINSSWFRILREQTGYESKDLMNPSVNAMFASWILLHTSSRLGNWSMKSW